MNIYQALILGPGMRGNCSFYYYFYYSSSNIQGVYESKNSTGIFSSGFPET